VGVVAFDLSVQEIKKLLGSRNQGFAFNMIQGLDNHIEDRLHDLQELTNLEIIHTALVNSNTKFEQIQDIQSFLDIKEQEIEFTESTPFIGELVDEILTEELEQTIEFYHDEYSYDVIEELFVTNAYGANVALGSGTSDYLQSDEEWWQITKDTGKYVGNIQFNEYYDSYSIVFAFRINDVDGNFLGVLRVLITLDDLLNEFIGESDLLIPGGRNTLLLDKNGDTIFSHEKILLTNTPIPYFSKIMEGNDVGYFELIDESNNSSLISYAKSTGYRTFEGFDWIVVVEQNNSSIVAEFVELRESILAVSISGMVASVIGGILISSTVSSPLRNLTKIANSISKGNFQIHVKKSRIDEINTISNSFEDMAKNLKKLIDTEKQLAEAHVKIKNERLAAIGELAASMAHDLKNPLGTIKSSAEILQKHSHQDDELNQVVNRMYRAIDRISHQINDVLNYVRITPLEVQSIKIYDLLKYAISALEIPKNISFSITDSDVEIKCDIRKLEIVFINIFLNAIQAIGENQGKIECKIEQKNSSVVIEIKNSGPGIPDDVFSRIFEPLITSKQKGTGLGLSTCKNIIEQHGGKISAQNDPTRFTIFLPISSEKHEDY
jgi:signal transduction histidine kinase